MTYNECYPERKIFQTEAKDTWIFGLYNTCSYNTPRGKQVFGTCCTRMYPQVPKRTSGNINFTPRKAENPTQEIFNRGRLFSGTHSLI